MFENQSKATSSAEQVVVVSDFKTGSTGELDRIVSNGSAEEEYIAGSSTQHQRWSKKDKVITIGFMLLFVGAVAFAVVVFRPGGPGNSSIQSSQGQIFNSVPTYWPASYMPTYAPTLDADIFEGATSFETSAKADKIEVTTEISGDGEGEGPGKNKPIPSPSAPQNPAPVQNSADGSGELPPAPTPPKPETPPFIETTFPMDTPIPTPTFMPSYAATESITNVATGMGSGESIETPFPMDTPIPTSVPSYAATESMTTAATGMGSGEGIETPIPTSMPSYAATESMTAEATGMGSGEGTATVSTETTGPPTLPNRDPVRT